MFYSGRMRGIVLAMLLPSAAIADEPRRVELRLHAGVHSSLVDRSEYRDGPYVGGVLDAQVLYRTHPWLLVGGFASVWSYSAERFDMFSGELFDARDVMIDVGIRAAVSHETFTAGPGIAFERDVTDGATDFTQFHAHAGYASGNFCLSTMLGWSSAIENDDIILFGRLFVGIRH